MNSIVISFSIALCSNFLPNTFAFDIDAALAFMNRTNWTEKDLNIVQDLVLSLWEQIGTDNTSKKAIEHLIDNNEVKVITVWLNILQQQNISENPSSIWKNLCYSFIGLIEDASVFEKFREKAVNVGLLDKFLSFVVSPILFNDEDLTQDIRGFALMASMRFFNGNLTSQSRAIMENQFGPKLSQFHNQFVIEESIIYKLYLAELLAQRNLTSMSQAELNEQFYMDSTIILMIRIYILASATSYLNNHDYDKLIMRMKTSYKYSRFLFTPFYLVRLFNALMLSEPNRLLVCDRESFNAFFFPAIELTGRLQIVVYATRGLFIATQTCTEYQQFFSEANVTHYFDRSLHEMRSDNHSAAYQEIVLMKEYWTKFKLLCPKTNFYFDSDDFGVKGRCSHVPIAGKTKSSVCSLAAGVISAVVLIWSLIVVLICRHSQNHVRQPLVEKQLPETGDLQVIPEISAGFVQMTDQLVKFLSQGRHGTMLRTCVNFDKKSEILALKSMKKSDPTESVTKIYKTARIINLAFPHSCYAEGQIMSRTKPHVNVVQLLATTQSFEDQKLLILEYCEFGSLYNLIPDCVFRQGISGYLPLKNGEKYLLTQQHLHAISYQIADGMVFLLKQKMLHRDLALRNVLITSEFVAKISNFGLAKISDEIYFARTITRLTPETAPEVKRHRIYSEKSEVFSFGILLALLFDLSISDYRHVVDMANESPRDLKKPSYAETTTCFDVNPGNRPTFRSLKDFFQNRMSMKFVMDLKKTLEKDVEDCERIKLMLKAIAENQSSNGQAL